MAAQVLLAFRWSARISGLLLVCLVHVFLFGQGLPNPFRQPPRVELEFLAMALMLLGFVAGWRWELIGGMTVLGGFSLFAAVELVAHGKPPHGAIPLFAVPGVLFLASHLGRRLRAVTD